MRRAEITRPRSHRPAPTPSDTVAFAASAAEDSLTGYAAMGFRGVPSDAACASNGGAEVTLRIQPPGAAASSDDGCQAAPRLGGAGGSGHTGGQGVTFLVACSVVGLVALRSRRRSP